MWWHQQPPAAKAHEQVHTRAENAIADALGGGDSLPAWNALWDLIQTGDTDSKRDMLAALKAYIDDTVVGESTAQAIQFEQALEESMTNTPSGLLPSKEVRQQHKVAQLEAHRTAMRKMGVGEGEGLPMWAIYMTRRSKRSWH